MIAIATSPLPVISLLKHLPNSLINGPVGSFPRAGLVTSKLELMIVKSFEPSKLLVYFDVLP